MLNKITESPITFSGGMLAGIGLLMLLIGLAFDTEEVWKTAMGLIGTGATIIGIFARDEQAARRAVREIKQDIAHTSQAGAREHQENVQRISQVEEAVHSVKTEAAAVATEKAKEVAQETAAAVAERKIVEEFRKGP
jgi:NADH/NAD ratio-sensing transcriptional regulator Rex